MHFYTLTINNTKQVKKAVPHVALQRIKYLGIKVRDMYSEKYKHSERKTNKWKDILYSWIGRSNMVKMPVVPRVTYRSKHMI